MFAKTFPSEFLKDRELSSTLYLQCLAQCVAIIGALWGLALACHNGCHLDLVDIELCMSTDYLPLQSYRETVHLWCQLTVMEWGASVARWHLDAQQDIGPWGRGWQRQFLQPLRESCWSFKIHVGGLRVLISLFQGLSRYGMSSLWTGKIPWPLIWAHSSEGREDT